MENSWKGKRNDFMHRSLNQPEKEELSFHSEVTTHQSRDSQILTKTAVKSFSPSTKASLMSNTIINSFRKRPTPSSKSRDLRIK